MDYEFNKKFNALKSKLAINKDNHVIIISNNSEKLANTAKEIDCEYYFCDVTDFKQVNNTINSIINVGNSTFYKIEFEK